MASKELDKAFYKFEWTARIHSIGFRKWRNKIMKLKLKKSIFFVNSSPEAIVYLVEKALLTCKIKQKITPVAPQNFVATRNALKLDLSQ